MKVKDLILKLQEMPSEANINVFDYRKNLFRGGGDNCSDGIESIVGVSIVPDDETVRLMLEDEEDVRQWVAIEYTNDDYTDDGFFSELISERFDATSTLKAFAAELSKSYGPVMHTKVQHELKAFLRTIAATPEGDKL